MASKNYSLIDIQNDDQEIDLQFQDFGNIETTPKSGVNENSQEQTIYFSNFPESHDDDQDRLLGEDSDVTSAKSTHSFWTFEYYQQFFNVESKQVGDRILWSMVPKPGVNYLQSYIRPNPDLYGPFWICVTLVFTTAITGNLANYLQTPDSYKWRYDFHKVTLATSCIFTYSWLVPLFLWGLLLLRGSKASLSLLELIALYGYSLAIFVPVSLLWMIPLKWLQWCLGIVASVLSGSVLVRTIHPAISHEAKRIALTIAVIILILHAALALGFMLYFFYPPNVTVATSEVVQSQYNQTSAVSNDLSKTAVVPKENIFADEKNGNKLKTGNSDVAKKKEGSVSKRADSDVEADKTKIDVISNEKNKTVFISASDSTLGASETTLKSDVTPDHASQLSIINTVRQKNIPIKINETDETSKLNSASLINEKVFKVFSTQKLSSS